MQAGVCADVCVCRRCMHVRVFVCTVCRLTHRVALAVVVAGVWVESSELHPAKTHLIIRTVEEATNVCSSL